MWATGKTVQLDGELERVKTRCQAVAPPKKKRLTVCAADAVMVVFFQAISSSHLLDLMSVCSLCSSST